MEIVLATAVIVAVAALIYYNRSARSLDINQDGKIDTADVVAAVDNATQGATVTAKKAAVKAKTAVRSAAKKTAARKPAAKTRTKK